MLLTVDIGNTNTSFGIFSGCKLVRKFTLPTASCARSTVITAYRAKITAVIIASVVPQATRALKTCLRKVLPQAKILVLGKNIKVPIKNLYRYPKQVGQDRLVNAYAAIKLYKAPAIVVDFGTAITFDVISKKKQYLGGMILPGMRISLEALNQKTALLPKINLAEPKEFIGKDTASSMISGIVYGFSCLTDGILEKIKKQTGRSTVAILTGGNTQLIRSYCRNFQYTDPDLTLKGLQLIYEATK